MAAIRVCSLTSKESERAALTSFVNRLLSSPYQLSASDLFKHVLFKSSARQQLVYIPHGSLGSEL